jgi:8-oxo-dGTP pyrophosphatase MutT (NUDIX family)
MILEELAEETNLTPPAVTPVTARALLFDHRVRSWEIVFSIVLPASCGHDCASPSGEYSKLAWMEIRRLAALRDGGSAPGQSPQLALTPAAVALLPLLPLPCAEIRA